MCFSEHGAAVCLVSGRVPKTVFGNGTMLVPWYRNNVHKQDKNAFIIEWHTLSYCTGARRGETIIKTIKGKTMNATQDRFGNLINFKPLTKEQTCPVDEIGKGPLLRKTVKQNGAEVEKQYQLDVCHIQRGRDEKTSSKGWRYWGKVISNKTEIEAEESIAAFGDFFGYQYIAAKLETIFNIENQSYCDKSVKDGWNEQDLLDTLTNRTVRGESQKAMVDDIKSIAAELAKLKPGTPEHLACMMRLAEASTKLVS